MADLAMAGGDLRDLLDFTGAMGDFVTTGLSSIPTGTHTITHLRRSVSYPVKTVSFQRGRVVAFQFLTPSAY